MLLNEYIMTIYHPCVILLIAVVSRYRFIGLDSKLMGMDLVIITLGLLLLIGAMIVNFKDAYYEVKSTLNEVLYLNRRKPNKKYVVFIVLYIASLLIPLIHFIRMWTIIRFIILMAHIVYVIALDEFYRKTIKNEYEREKI